MKSNELITLLLFISAILTSGCGPATTMTAASVPHPVLLGKIQSVQTAEGHPLPKIVPFNVEIHKRGRFAGVRFVGDGPNYELLRQIDSPSDTVIIDEIYFGASSWVGAVPCVGGEVYNDSWVNIVGGIHKFPAGTYDTK